MAQIAVKPTLAKPLRGRQQQVVVLRRAEVADEDTDIDGEREGRMDR